LKVSPQRRDRKGHAGWKGKWKGRAGKKGWKDDGGKERVSRKEDVRQEWREGGEESNLNKDRGHKEWRK
jgi:hypothetical protein